MTDILTISELAGLDPTFEGSLSAPHRADTERRIDAALTEARAGAPLAGVASLLLDALGAKLVTPLAGLIAEGWKQDAALKQALEGGTKQPAPYGEVALHTHALTTTLRPKAKVLLKTVVIATVEFAVALKLELKAFRLVVENAHWTGVKAGEISGKLSVHWVSQSAARTQVQLMPDRSFKYKADTQLLLPAGGIKLV